MSSFWWYLSRATGIVATLLIVGALLWGLLFSARATGNRLRPNWWLDLHNWLGGLALAFTVVHMLAVFMDTDAGIGLVELFVPGSVSINPTPITWGVLAFYGIAIITISSYAPIKRRIPRKVWHGVHLLSLVAAVMTGLHAWQAGSDAGLTWFAVGLAVCAGVAVYPGVLRLIGIGQKAQRARG